MEPRKSASSDWLASTAFETKIDGGGGGREGGDGGCEGGGSGDKRPTAGRAFRHGSNSAQASAAAAAVSSLPAVMVIATDESEAGSRPTADTTPSGAALRTDTQGAKDTPAPSLRRAAKNVAAMLASRSRFASPVPVRPIEDAIARALVRSYGAAVRPVADGDDADSDSDSDAGSDKVGRQGRGGGVCAHGSDFGTGTAVGIPIGTSLDALEDRIYRIATVRQVGLVLAGEWAPDYEVGVANRAFSVALVDRLSSGSRAGRLLARAAAIAGFCMILAGMVAALFSAVGPVGNRFRLDAAWPGTDDFFHEHSSVAQFWKTLLDATPTPAISDPMLPPPPPPPPPPPGASAADVLVATAARSISAGLGETGRYALTVLLATLPYFFRDATAGSLATPLYWMALGGVRLVWCAIAGMALQVWARPRLAGWYRRHTEVMRVHSLADVTAAVADAVRCHLYANNLELGVREGAAKKRHEWIAIEAVRILRVVRATDAKRVTHDFDHASFLSQLVVIRGHETARAFCEAWCASVNCDPQRPDNSAPGCILVRHADKSSTVAGQRSSPTGGGQRSSPTGGGQRSSRTVPPKETDEAVDEKSDRVPAVAENPAPVVAAHQTPTASGETRQIAIVAGASILPTASSLSVASSMSTPTDVSSAAASASAATSCAGADNDDRLCALLMGRPLKVAASEAAKISAAPKPQTEPRSTIVLAYDGDMLRFLQQADRVLRVPMTLRPIDDDDALRSHA